MNKYNDEHIARLKRKLTASTTTVVRATIARTADAKPAFGVFENILKETAARMRVLTDPALITVVIDVGFEPDEYEINAALDKAVKDAIYLRDRMLEDEIHDTTEISKEV